MPSKLWVAACICLTLAVQASSDEKSAQPASKPLWSSVGATKDIRESSGLVLLPDGRVLVVGGHADTANRKWRLIGTAELYDPKKESWQPTGSLVQPRQGVGTIVLLGNGRVLLAGEHETRTGAELYDPGTGKWATTGYLRVGRGGHTTTLLKDGRVLIAGGVDFYAERNPVFASSELYDPKMERWVATGSMKSPRTLHWAILLPSGKVLVVGGRATEDTGDPLASAELFDPASGTWKQTGSMSQERQNHTVTLLRDGKVLVAGGKNGNAGGKKSFASAEIYHPETEKWTDTKPMAHDRCQFTATLLADGRVLVVGGAAVPFFIARDSAEIYDPKLGTWSSAGKMAASRWNHRAVLLPSGQVLVVGGCNGFGNMHLSSVELFTPP
jgi:N-acetylneuraminic acid mutarotase